MPHLFKIIASKINCSWRIIPSIDGLIGSTKDDGSSSGVFGMLQRGEIDLSLVDFSVTTDRAKVKIVHYCRNNLL